MGKTTIKELEIRIEALEGDLRIARELLVVLRERIRTVLQLLGGAPI